MVGLAAELDDRRARRPQFLPFDFALAMSTVLPCEICFNTPLRNLAIGEVQYVLLRLTADRKQDESSARPANRTFIVFMSDSPS